MKKQNYSKIFDIILEMVKHFPKQASLEDIKTL